MSDKKAPSVVAFVHAKGVSERLPGKNLRVLGDRPLVCHAIRNAQEAKRVDLVVIDSDSDEILKVSEEAGAVPWKRPPGLATNDATGDDLACWQALIACDAQCIVQVGPTCPFTSSESIDAAVERVVDQGYKCAIGVITRICYRWESGPNYYTDDGRLKGSQEMTPECHETTGLYAFRRGLALRHRRRVDLEYAPGMVEQTLIEGINIDTEEDWQLAELVWKGMQC